MSDPTAEALAPDAQATPWLDAMTELVAAKTYWLATARPDGRPHVMPVWGVWLENRFYFSTAGNSRKGRNLAANSSCSIVFSSQHYDIAVEGTAEMLTDAAMVQRVVDLYVPKYDWPMTVRDDGIYGESGEGGPLYVLTPTVAFGFGVEDFSVTRWRF